MDHQRSVVAFHQSIDSPNAEALKDLAKQYPEQENGSLFRFTDILNTPFNGLVPLQRAAWNDDKVLISLLLELGAEVDGVAATGNEEEDPVMGESPLMITSESNSIACSLLLLEKGADPSFFCDGVTPLHGAVKTGNSEIVKLILEFGGDPDLCGGEYVNGSDWNGKGQTALEVAKALKFQEIEMLLESWEGRTIKG